MVEENRLYMVEIIMIYERMAFMESQSDRKF